MRVVLIVLLCSCSCLLTAQIGEHQLEKASFTSASGQEVQAERGSLTVPEYRADPSSGTIEVAYIRLLSEHANPVAPIIYLEGGPGASCSWQADNPHMLDNWLPLLEVGDVILLDQRGTGAAGQHLTWINEGEIPSDVLVSAETMDTYLLNMARSAFPIWEARGIDLRGYTTLESARDIEDLRLALDLPKISLLGFSYGTQLGQAYMKHFGQNLERVVLSGVEGLAETFKLPNRMDAALHRLSAFVAADEFVNQEVPDLAKTYERVSQRLAASPIKMEVTNLLTREPMELLLGKFALDLILFFDLGDANDLPVFPRLLYTMDQGDYTVFRWFVEKRYRMVFGLNAMSTTMDLVSGVSPGRLGLIEEQLKQSIFGNVINPYMALLEIWPVEALGEEYQADFHSTVPTLLLSGSLDFNTPPYQAERLRWNLPNSRHIVVQNAGHEQVLPHPEVQQAILKFFRGEEVGDISAAYPPLQFIPVTGEREGVRHPAAE